jgi:hypothetical protein
MTTWEKSLRDILSDEDVDFGNMASILVDLFEGVVVPDIFLTHANKVAVQQIFSVKVSTVCITITKSTLNACDLEDKWLMMNFLFSDGGIQETWETSLSAWYILLIADFITKRNT